MFCTKLRHARLSRDPVNPDIVSYLCADMEEFKTINEQVIKGGRLGVKRRFWIDVRLVHGQTGEVRAIKGDEVYALLDTTANAPASTPPAPPAADTPPAAKKRRGRPPKQQ